MYNCFIANGGLGDIIALTSKCVNNKKFYISTFSEEYQKRRVFEILGLLDISNNIDIFKDVNSKQSKLFLVQHNKELYETTKINWNNTKTKNIISFQIYSKSGSCIQQKVMSKKNFELYNKLIKKYKKYEFIKLGNHFSIEQNVKILSQSKFFFGIDSGMSHLSHCTKTPTLLWNWNMIDFYHPNKEFTKINSIKELEKYINE